MIKLSKTAWNNVIIFSVMIIILFINGTNDRLFPADDNNADDALILPEHSVVLTLSITLPTTATVNFQRVGKAWQMTSQGILLDLTNQQIDQLMYAWQQSSGLVQADDMIVEGQAGIEVNISLAAVEQEQRFMVYPLVDQLLVYNVQKKLWLALPTAMSKQLIPVAYVQ